MTETPKTETVDVVVTPPEPVTAASAVVGYPHVIPADERPTTALFRGAGVVLVAAVAANVGLLWWAIATGALA